MIIAFTIPGEPKGKLRARVTMRGGKPRAYTPAKTVAYEGGIAKIAAEAMQRADCPQFDGPVSLEVYATHAIPKSWPARDKALAAVGEMVPTGPRNDLDNVIKAISDALNGVVYRDDGQVVRIAASKRYGAEPCVHVEVQAA